MRDNYLKSTTELIYHKPYKCECRESQIGFMSVKVYQLKPINDFFINLF